jgi:hypothetical protein
MGCDRPQGELDAGLVDANVLHYTLEPHEDTPLVVLRVNLGIVCHALHRGHHGGVHTA